MGVHIRSALKRVFLDIPIVLSLTGPMMLLAAFLMLGIAPAVIPLLIAVFGPFSIYLFNRVSDIDEDMTADASRAVFFSKHRTAALAAAVVAQLAALILALSRSLFLGGVTVVPIVVSFLYSIGDARLKQYLFVKNIVIGTMWGFIAFLPLAWTGEMTAAVIFPLLFIVLKVGADSILADVKDIEADSAHGITTIPQQWGIPGTRKFLYVLNTVAYGVIATGIVSGALPGRASILLLGYPYSVGVSHLTGWVDAQNHADIYADAEFYLIGALAVVGLSL